MAELPDYGVLVVKCPGFVVDPRFRPIIDLLTSDTGFGGSCLKEEAVQLSENIPELGKSEAHLLLHMEETVEVRSENTPVGGQLTHRIYLLSVHKSPWRPWEPRAHSAGDC